MKDILVKELGFCLKIWDKKWWCTFWWWTKCHQCATPYLLLKLINWEVLHWDIQRLSLEEWKQKFNSLKDVMN